MLIHLNDTIEHKKSETQKKLHVYITFFHSLFGLISVRASVQKKKREIDKMKDFVNFIILCNKYLLLIFFIVRSAAISSI